MYFIDAYFQNDVHKVGVFKNAVEFNDVLMMQGFVDFDLREKLHREWVTFCLALFF